MDMHLHTRIPRKVGAHTYTHMGFPGGSDGKASAYNEEDPGSIPGSGRSPGKEKFKMYFNVSEEKQGEKWKKE